ncbi:MAG: formaldehyde-activating enzyme [Chloroflexi bacterium]|nr:formaldehyde-activating enzyme [Chloroflexota bacterium]
MADQTIPLQTQIGEAFAGSGANAAHINSVLGSKGGPVETAWTTALATPRAGYIPFVTVLRPNLPVKPLTLFVNKADLRGSRHETLTWGAAQAGVATGVMQAVADGIIPAEMVDSLLLIAAVWVSWDADDAALVFDNNAQAMRSALEAGANHHPRIEDILRLRDQASNPFFSR